MRFAALVLLVSSLAYVALGNDDGWNFTPLKGARNKQDANFLALAASFETDDPRLPVWFASFKSTFYKTYPTADLTEEQAYKNFLANLNKIFLVNSDLEVPFWLSGNFYADYDLDLFRQRFLMTNLNLTLPGRRLTGDEPIPETELLARRKLQGSTVDWRNSGKLSPVKDQGGCGSCWAYSATAAIEAAYNIFTGLPAATTQVDLAEQQLIECVSGSTCSGGSSDDAIRYVYNKWQNVESLYPSTYRDGSCRAGGSPPNGQAVSLGQATLYPGGYSEAALMASVAKQPTVFYFEVAGDFYSYSGGIYRPTSCGSNINHAMVAVGYYYTGNPSTSYWIIRNSWGAFWGQNGYAYIQMTGNSVGPCGMYQFVFAPPLNFDLTLPGPAPQRSPPPPRIYSPPPNAPIYSPPPNAPPPNWPNTPPANPPDYPVETSPPPNTPPGTPGNPPDAPSLPPPGTPNAPPPGTPSAPSPGIPSTPNAPRDTPSSPPPGTPPDVPTFPTFPPGTPGFPDAPPPGFPDAPQPDSPDAPPQPDSPDAPRSSPSPPPPRRRRRPPPSPKPSPSPPPRRSSPPPKIPVRPPPRRRSPPPRRRRPPPKSPRHRPPAPPRSPRPPRVPQSPRPPRPPPRPTNNRG